MKKKKKPNTQPDWIPPGHRAKFDDPVSPHQEPAIPAYKIGLNLVEDDGGEDIYDVPDHDGPAYIDDGF